MFEVSNQGFLRSLSPFRPSPGVPRGPRHVYHVSHLEYLTLDLIELQQCARGVVRGFQGCSVLLNNPQVAHVTLDTCTAAGLPINFKMAPWCQQCSVVM